MLSIKGELFAFPKLNACEAVKSSIVQEDRVLQYDIHTASEFISTLEIDAKELF